MAKKKQQHQHEKFGYANGEPKKGNPDYPGVRNSLFDINSVFTPAGDLAPPDKNNYQPQDVELELTQSCNADCPLCYRNYNAYEASKGTRLTKIRPLTDIMNQLGSIQFDFLKSVKLVGTISEPTLYPDFFDLIRYFNALNIEIEICTNGDTHNEFWWRKLGTLMKPKDKVYFTVCGNTQELHEKYRKGTNLENILDRVRAFQSGFKTNYPDKIGIDYAQAIQFKYNQHLFLMDIDDGADAPGLDYFLWLSDLFSNVYLTKTFLHNSPNLYKKYQKELEDGDFLPNDKDRAKYLKVKALASKNWILHQKNIRRTNVTCIAKEDNTIQLDIDGLGYPCYLFSEYAQDQPNKLQDWNYDKIQNFSYVCCKFCEKNTRNLIDELEVDHII